MMRIVVCDLKKSPLTNNIFCSPTITIIVALMSEQLLNVVAGGGENCCNYFVYSWVCESVETHYIVCTIHVFYGKNLTCN